MLRLLPEAVRRRRHLPSLIARRAASGTAGVRNRDPSEPPRLFVVQPRLRPDSALEPKLNEALCLANSLEEQRDGFFVTDFFDKGLPPHAVVQNPSARGRVARADTYFGPGTVDNVKCLLNEAETKAGETGDVDAVFVNAILSGVQQRNLERIWGKPVLDRVGLIIEIFNAHAFTKEAKLQAELAALMYKKTRLVRVRGLDGRLAFGVGGEAEVVSARGRGSGGRGFISGAGETELQLQRRRILERRSHLLTQIKEVRRTRALQRAARKRQEGADGLGLATVAVVGYTNAGKSTLVGELSQTDLYSDDRLFATVDPRLRSVILPSGRKVLLSDTVGFISDLPVQLVEAFHATLEEVVEADLLVHVLDSSAPNLEDHRSTVLLVLEQIGVSEEKLRDMIEVWNKIDLQDEQEEREEDHLLVAENEEQEADSEVEDDTTLACELEDKNIMDEDYQDGNETVTECDQGGDDGPIEFTDASSPGGEMPCDKTGKPSKAADICSSFAREGPHVRTSAVTGVGLQELLELIDEKLTSQEDKSRAEKVAEDGTFYKKWRPPHGDNAAVAA